MGKKRIADFDDFDDDVVLDKKMKRKLARQAAKDQQQSQQPAAPEEQDDTMSRVALLCQENRWREAVQLCRTALADAEEACDVDLAFTLQMALPKLEYSLRRQMVAAVVNAMKSMLNKEALLDAGE